MKYPILLTVVILLVACALFAGCTSPTAAEIRPAETQAPVAPSVQPSSVATVVATPVAIETLPAEQYVDLVLSKQRPDSSIHLVFNGGKGEVFVQNILMRVTYPDGTVAEQYMNDGVRKPRRNDELIMEGSRGNDRVEVFITTAGRTYKLIDKPIALSYL